MSLELRAILAGLFFGAWPLFMNRSGLSGNVSSALFSLGVFILVLPFAIQTGGATLKIAAWMMASAAVVAGAIGLLSFNNMLAQAARLFNLERERCEELLHSLVDAKFLIRTQDGAFRASFHASHWSCCSRCWRRDAAATEKKATSSRSSPFWQYC